MSVFEVKEVCKSCGGTGLYVGICERDGAAVVCHTCNGTGCHAFKYEYIVFEKKKKKAGIKRVFAASARICIGEKGKGKNYKLSDFGGIPYEDWIANKPFPAKSEMRLFTCPAQWYQNTNYNKKPEWKECGFGSFRDCEYFKQKHNCWKRFDGEFKK